VESAPRVQRVATGDMMKSYWFRSLKMIIPVPGQRFGGRWPDGGIRLEKPN